MDGVLLVTYIRHAREASTAPTRPTRRDPGRGVAAAAPGAHDGAARVAGPPAGGDVARDRLRHAAAVRDRDHRRPGLVDAADDAVLPTLYELAERWFGGRRARDPESLRARDAARAVRSCAALVARRWRRARPRRAPRADDGRGRGARAAAQPRRDRGAPGDRGAPSWTSWRRGSTRTRAHRTTSATWCWATATRSGGMRPSPRASSSSRCTRVGVCEIIDVWAKRGARAAPPSEGVEHRRLLVEDALREIVYAVRSAFADVLREQSERELARDVADRYAETVRLSQARFRAGDISEADLRKIELEAHRYQNDVIDAEMQLDLGARAASRRCWRSRRRASCPASAMARAGARARVRRRPALIDRALDAAARPARRGRGARRWPRRARVGEARGAPRHRARRGLHAQRLHGRGRQPQHAGAQPVAPAAALRSQPGRTSGAPSWTSAAPRTTASACASPSRARWRGGPPQPARGGAAVVVRDGGRLQRLGMPTATRTGRHAGARRDRAARRREVVSRRAPSRCSSCWRRSAPTWTSARQYLRAIYDFRQAAVDVTHAVGEPMTVRCCENRSRSPRRSSAAVPACTRATARKGARASREARTTSSATRPGTRRSTSSRSRPSPSTRARRRCRCPGKVGFDEDHTQRVASPIDGRAIGILVKLGDQGQGRPGAGRAVVAQRRADPGRRAEGPVGPERRREVDRARSQAAGRGRRRREGGRAGRGRPAQGQVRLRADDRAAARPWGCRPSDPAVGVVAARADRGHRRRAQRAGRAGGPRRSATPLMTISSLDTVWVLADAYEQDLGLVAEGDAVVHPRAGLPGRGVRGQGHAHRRGRRPGHPHGQDPLPGPERGHSSSPRCSRRSTCATTAAAR